MATHTQHFEKDCFYFITFTCYRWLPLFAESSIHEYLPVWFKGLSRKGFLLCGYVIMPNHLHFLLFALPQSQSLNQSIGTGKRFLAYEIIRRLRARNLNNTLRSLSTAVRPKEQFKGKKHQVFRPSFDAKICDSVEMIESVLDYMHHNPVAGKWSLVDEFPDYKLSSASFYENGTPSRIPVTDYRVILDGEYSTE